MNVLGVIFDSKLNWNAHIANAISKAKKAFFALRLFNKFFNTTDMRALLDSNFYSILYYNSVIWLTPKITAVMKQSLLSISANALRSCMMVKCAQVYFENVHVKCKKVLPPKYP